MKINRKRKSTIFNKVRFIVLVSLVLIVAVTMINYQIMSYMRQQTMQYLDNLATLYIQEADHNFFKIGRRLVTVLMGDQGTQKDINDYLKVVEKNEDSLDVVVAIDQLQEIFMEYSWEYGRDYHFFAFLDERQSFLRLYELDRDTINVDKLIQEQIVNLIHSDQTDTYSIKKKWDVVTVGTDNYLVKLMKAKGRYLGCFIKADNLLKSLEAANVKNKGIYILVNQENQIVSHIGAIDSQNIEKILQDENKKARFTGYIVLDKSFSRIPFHVKICIDNYGVFEKVLTVQLMMVCITLIIFLTQTSMMIYIARYILRPIQKFTDNLLKYDNNDYILDISNSELKELEDANEQFRNLLRQMKKLKITIYEKELEKQRIKTDYMQLQIKPHFYLNCMNLIYHMVDMELLDDAKKMLLMVSDYLRYLFQSDKDFVLIKDELTHVKEYLEIYKMRYHTAFEYTLFQDVSTLMKKIPPLVIQTFVENSVKHIVTLDDQIEIRIDVHQEIIDHEEMLLIRIADSGTGFPQEIIDKLGKGESLQTESGSRIGITNCLNRIRYFYPEKGRALFYNSDNGGAVVELYLPITEE